MNVGHALCLFAKCFGLLDKQKLISYPRSFFTNEAVQFSIIPLDILSHDNFTLLAHPQIHLGLYNYS